MKGSKLQSESPCHLRGPVELIQAQFPRFAGVLGVRRRRHGDRTTAAPPPRRRGGLADGGRVSGGPALARTPPSGAPRTAPPRGPSPGSRRRRPSRRSAAPGTGLSGRGRPVPSRRSDSSSHRRRRRRHGPGAGPCVTSARPRPPPPAAGTSPGGARGWQRRGRRFPAPGARAARGPRSSPRAAAVPSPKAPWGPPLRRAGPGVAGPRGGAASPRPVPPAALGACMPASPARLLRSPSPGSQGGGGESRRGVSAAAVLRPREHGRVPTCPGSPPHPGDLRRPPPWLSLHPPTRSPPRGLGATARDVQTQLSARAKDSRIAFGQSGAAARGGGGRRPGGTGG